MKPALVDVLRCPVCAGRLELRDARRNGDVESGRLGCPHCAGEFPIERGMPLLLDDRLPGMAEKRREIAAWPEKARQEGWYVEDDEVDLTLPDVTWDDLDWRANAHSFSLLLERYVSPGMRVLEVGAARCWGALHLVPRGVQYVATDILDDPLIGLGRGEFYERHVGPFERVQADGEHLPFADGAFDLAYCVASLHHALDAPRMVREMARVTRRGGIVAALNEGTRPPGGDRDAPQQRAERELGINEHVHTLWAYLASFLRARLLPTRIEYALGYDVLSGRKLGRVLRYPGGRFFATLWALNLESYSGVSLYARKLA
jgi:SAM-dependent methyltransferase